MRVLTLCLGFITLLKVDSILAQGFCHPQVEFEVGDTTTYRDRLLPVFKCNIIKSLTIKITSNKGWIVFSHVQGFDFGVKYSTKTKLGFLPEELGIAKELELLDVSDLGISRLPKNLSKLSKLKSLDISFNRINLSDELKKILLLDRLKVIKIYGCNFTLDDLTEIKLQRPDLKVLHSEEHFDPRDGR
jgi:hypothetical protein